MIDYDGRFLLLPSLNFYGNFKIKFKNLTFSDIYYISKRQSLNLFEINHLINSLIDVDLYDLSIQDRDYLYLYLFFQIYEECGMKAVCKFCGNKIENKFKFEDFSVTYSKFNLEKFVDYRDLNLVLSPVTVREEEFIYSLNLKEELEFIYYDAMYIKSFKNYFDRFKFFVNNRISFSNILYEYKKEYKFGLNSISFKCNSCDKSFKFSIDRLLDVLKIKDFDYPIMNTFEFLQDKKICKDFNSFLSLDINILNLF